MKVEAIYFSSEQVEMGENIMILDVEIQTVLKTELWPIGPLQSMAPPILWYTEMEIESIVVLQEETLMVPYQWLIDQTHLLVNQIGDMMLYSEELLPI